MKNENDRISFIKDDIARKLLTLSTSLYCSDYKDIKYDENRDYVEEELLHNINNGDDFNTSMIKTTKRLLLDIIDEIDDAIK